MESHIEKSVVKYVEDVLKGEALKLRIDGKNGFPDRSIKLPNGIEFLIEFKTPKGTLRSAQKKWIKRLRELGSRVYIVDNVADGEMIVKYEALGRIDDAKELGRSDEDCGLN